MTRLRDHTWQESFTSSQGNLLEGFYRPALQVYWRSCCRWHLGPGFQWDFPMGPGHLRRGR